METKFVDFWSINRWLCQYEVITDGDGEWVDEAMIIHPLAETPYESTNIFRYWNPEKLDKYLNYLDSWTGDICSFGKDWGSGRTYPPIEFILFPCADGRYYAAYPTVEPKYYVRAFDFSPNLCSSKASAKARIEETGQLWLDRGQKEIDCAAWRLWSCVLRSQREEGV